MQEIVVRMRRVSQDLRQIRECLDELRVNDVASQQILDEVFSLDLVRDFKATIDEVRLFLWQYFQAALNEYSSQSEDSFQQYRLRRVTEMLRAVQEEVPVRDDHSDVRSLFERLQNIADVAVERHFAASVKSGRE